MEQEILNIEHHVKQLVVKALNKTDSIESAAKKLWLTTRTVFRYKRQYNILKVNDRFIIYQNQN